ncbi:MAG TPA: hypothetical protein VMS99_11570 [Acidimicrobiia bacterium]|nr:hypothetical protein [Acidimicrobiia bacterium]
MEIAIVALGVLGLAFAGITMTRAKPNVVAERVPAHPDTFELWNEGPGIAVIIHADVVSPNHPEGIPIDDAQQALAGLSVDSRISRDSSPWAKGSPLEPLRRFEVRLPSATTLRIVYRAQGWLGSMATDTVVIEGRH